MRKMLWGGGAAAVVVLGLGYLVYDYAQDHPTSWLGRCFVTAHHAATTQAHAVRTTRHTADASPVTADPFPGTGSVGEEPSEGTPHTAPAPEEACQLPPAVLPGSVMMHENDALPAQPMPPVRDVVGVLPFLGAIEEPENDRMPRVEDESPKMPRVPDDRADRGPGAGGFWLFPLLPF